MENDSLAESIAKQANLAETISPTSRTDAWLRENIDDTYSDTDETEDSPHSDSPVNVTKKKKTKRDSNHAPTLADLQLVGDILFAERTTVGYSVSEQKELLALGDVSRLETEGRSNLFEKGIEFEKKGKPGLALQCYLACIQGLDGQVDKFPQLPLCLRHISRLYFAEEDYEKAVHFVQAEKLYYEAAILASEPGKEDEQDDEEGEEDEDDDEDEEERKVSPKKPADLIKMMTERAQEFEQLADMCLHNKNVGLALDYIGKAAKINESVYGKSDHRSRQTYEKFSYIYAEAGKLQYNDALLRFQKKNSQSTLKERTPAITETSESLLDEEVFTPEQSLTQKVFSLALLFVFLVIIIIEVTLVVLSFSKGYLYVPSSGEVLNALRYMWLKITGNRTG